MDCKVYILTHFRGITRRWEGDINSINRVGGMPWRQTGATQY